MRLLSSHRAELHTFDSPESVPGGYAILSHTWSKNEQTYQDLQRLKERCAQPWSRKTPRDLASAKIRGCCELAQRHGYDWVWIDTCCIDKSSSAELQEAINSMFHYYSLAEVCYAYLEDVPTDSAFVDHPYGGTDFSRSVWHGRGWTLQELIAPRFVLFLSQSWEHLGSKTDLAERIEAVTSIPESVLRHEAVIDQFSIAQRMSWAAARTTTRPEDEAYCLMGLFDVNMPTIYGEGRNAFQRLQEEIMRRNPDTTVFAWGNICDFGEPAERFQSRFTLFARSPADFRGCRSLTQGRDELERDQRRDDAGAAGITTLSITPHGVLANVCIVQTRGLHFADFGWDDEHGGRLLLCLAPHLNGPEDAAPSFDIAHYSLTRRGQYASESSACRLMRIRSTAPDPSASMSLWRQRTYLAYGVKSTLPVSYTALKLPMDTSLDAPFRLNKSVLAEVWSKYHATPKDFPESLSPSLRSWPDDSPVVFGLVFGDIFGWVDVRLGICTRDTGAARVHWANVRCCDECPASRLERDHGGGTSVGDHDCPADHIIGWSHLEKTFRIVGGHLFTLRFARCGISPERTMLLVTIQAHTIPRSY